MKKLHVPKKGGMPSPPVPKPPAQLTLSQLQGLSTDQLVKLLMSPEFQRSANALQKQQIVDLLRQREGEAFVSRLIGNPQKSALNTP